MSEQRDPSAAAGGKPDASTAAGDCDCDCDSDDEPIVYGMWSWAESDPQRLATIAPDGTATGYGEMAARCNRLSHGLLGLGLREGSRLLLVARNSHTWLEVYFAAWQIGVSTVPVSWHLTARELAYIASDSRAELAIVDANAGAAGEALDALDFDPVRRFTTVPRDGFRSLAQLSDGEPGQRPQPPRTAAALLYTSGTSGRPKGVLRPAPRQLAPGEVPAGVKRDFEHGMTLGRGVNLTAAPLYHAAPGRAAIDALEMGLSVVVMERFDAEAALALIERHRVSSFFMPPILLQRLLALPEQVRARYDVSSVRTITHTGAPCPRAVKRRLIEWFGPVLWEIYGGTESFATHVGSHDWLAHQGTVGRARSEQSRVRIVDEQGRELPDGDIGLIQIHSPMSVSFEYLGDREKTAAAIDADGFVTIGDLGYVDAEGWLFISDRRSDMILSGGVNVYPAEIEDVLAAHDAVADVGVIGVPDEHWGQRIVAIAALAPGHEPSAALALALIDHCRRDLAGFKCPRRIEFAPVPRSEAGKLLRAQLRETWTPVLVASGEATPDGQTAQPPADEHAAQPSSQQQSGEPSA